MSVLHINTRVPNLVSRIESITNLDIIPDLLLNVNVVSTTTSSLLGILI